MQKNDLRFLLKDKYGWDDTKISKMMEAEWKDGMVPANNSRVARGPEGSSKREAEDCLEEPYHPSQLEQILTDAKLLESGYPLAYVIGHVDFLGCRINLNYKTLIPRPETEYWVNTLISDIRIGCVLDLFCGSGCIGISLLKHIPNIHVTFADIDKNAIKQTKENLKLNKIDISRYTVIKSDIFKNVTGKFNYIFANPPYVGMKDQVGVEVFHEPSIAIFGGKEGLDLITPFLAEAHDYLDKGGCIYMEFGKDQKEKISRRLNGKPFSRPKFQKDQFAKWRWLELKAF